MPNETVHIVVRTGTPEGNPEGRCTVRPVAAFTDLDDAKEYIEESDSPLWLWTHPNGDRDAPPLNSD